MIVLQLMACHMQRFEEVWFLHYLRVHPLLSLRRVDNVTVKVDRQHELGSRLLPRVSVPEPVVRFLDLLAVLNLLSENTVLVADTVSVSGQSEGGHAVEEARSETSQSSVSQTRVLLQFLKLLDVQSHLPVFSFINNFVNIIKNINKI